MYVCVCVCVCEYIVLFYKFIRFYISYNTDVLVDCSQSFHICNFKGKKYNTNTADRFRGNIFGHYIGGSN